MGSSRLIVKNLPKHATETRLREHFAALGEVTDCKLQKTSSGRSRQFAFVGYRTEAEAKAAAKHLNKSFFDTAKILVEAAKAPGSSELERAWSQHTPGSSAHSRKNKREAAPAPVAPGGGSVLTMRQIRAMQDAKAAEVKKKGNVKKQGSRTEKEVFVADDEGAQELGVVEPKPPLTRSAKDNVAFDEDLSDLAYLKKKSSLGTAGKLQQEVPPEPEAAGAAEQEAARRQRRRRARAPAPEADGAAADPAGEGDGKKEPPGPAGDGAADGAAAPQGDADADREELESTGRLYVTNLPYGATEEELRGYFESFGEVASVYICKDEDTLKSRGFGYVSFVFPECAIRAVAELNLQPFQGRLMHVAAARTKPSPDEVPLPAAVSQSTSYKRKKAEQQKKVQAHQENTWNLLYVSANAAADAAAQQLGVAKSDLFGKDAEGAAVTAAFTETSIIQQTKQWLQKEGIRVDAFERSGPSLVKSQAVGEALEKRCEDAFIVKHLPAGASLQELRDRFARYGELVRCSMAPSGTVAVVQYVEKARANKAFEKLAFARYRHVPLYLEWAPVETFDRSAPGTETVGGASGSSAQPEAGAADGQAPADGGEAAGGDEEAAGGCLFVKNLNFSTTDAGLKAAFKRCKGFRSAIVMKKKAALRKGDESSQQQTLSMGYGFLEFDTAANATEALKRKQGFIVDGHAVQLQISQAKSARRGEANAGGGKKAKAALKTSKLCVRNLAFETTKKELRQLFGAYGSVVSVRIPKKADYSGHRGFGFVDFASTSEAAAAYEALQHTHLYGRRLVLEPAEEKPNDVGVVHEETKKRMAGRALQSEAKRRRRAGVLNAAGDEGAFEDAML